MASERAELSEISYSEALLEAQEWCLSNDSSVLLFGLGVPDPKGIFGSTVGLQETFGDERVFDIPLSEHALTGVAIGAAINGQKPILTHQRVDFSLVSIDQIVNQAAKWAFMFNGETEAGIVIRMIVGRGWGQGPQHSQSLHAWFSHIPGLKVLMPATAFDAKGMLISAVFDRSPTIIFEHRWLYELKDMVPRQGYSIPLGQARVIRTGVDLSIVSLSYMTVEALKAAEFLSKYNVCIEVVDIRSIRPLDEATILRSVAKTGRVLIIDQADLVCSVASHVSSFVSEALFGQLKSAPVRLGLPDHPVPTSSDLSRPYYPSALTIVTEICEMLDLAIGKSDLLSLYVENADQPDASFIGPF
ncbi:hypothetical protein OAM79_02585 [Litorivicinus sp.]|nr:hypothetical protein [Litorivicinus sp.]